MTNLWLLGFVLPAIFAFIATSTPKDYKCPVCNSDDAKIGYNGYGMCMNCGWMESIDD